MPNAYPREFRLDVVQVARNREPGVTLEKIAHDFGVHPITLSTWLKRAEVEEGVKPGISSVESAQLREANKRIRLLVNRPGFYRDSRVVFSAKTCA